MYFQDTKIQKICYSDKDKINPRENLRCVYFKDGYAFATDTHIGVKISLKEEGFTDEQIKAIDGKFLHASKFKSFKKGIIINSIDESGITLLKKGGSQEVISFDVPKHFETNEPLKFPPLEKLISELEEEVKENLKEGTEENPPSVSTFGINAKKLSILEETLESNYVKLYLGNRGDRFLVRGHDNDKGVGVIMLVNIGV